MPRISAVRETRKIFKKPRKALKVDNKKFPNIVVVGNADIRKKILSIEKKFALSLIFCGEEDYKKSINYNTIAIIVDEKEVTSKVKKFFKEFFVQYKFLPAFYLSRKQKSSNFYAELYGLGLQGAINWPKEAKVLAELLIEALKPHPKAIGNTKGDARLSKVIKSHLLLTGGPKSLKVKVIDGFVFLTGKVRSLSDKQLIHSECSRVLGVKKIILKDLKVSDSSNTTDKELERKIKMYMGNILGDKKRAVSIKVKNKIASLLGSVSNHDHVLSIEKFIMKQPGIQHIKREYKYLPSLVSKNTKKAKLIEEKVKKLFDGVKFISVTMYGDTAEISGTVKTHSDRILVEEYVLQSLPVRKLINKIFI